MRLRTLTAVSMLFLAACSADAPTMADPGWRSVAGRHDGNFVGDVGDFVELVGCRPMEGQRDSATVALPSRTGGLLRFNCANVARDSVRAAIQLYRTAVKASLGGASAESGDPEGGGDGSFIYRFTSYHCEVTTYWTYVPFWGEYVVTGRSADCTWVEHYWDPNSGGPSPETPSADSVVYPEATPCDQSVNPACHIAMTELDNERLDASYSFLRDTTGVWADTIAQAQCKELMAGLRMLRALPAPGGVFRGLNTTGTNHNAQGYQGAYKLHFDPPTLDGAVNASGQKKLLRAGLHEVAHAMGLADHGTSTNYANFSYFKYTDPQGPNSCVRQ